MNKKKKLDQNTIQTAKRLLKYMTGTHKIQFIIVFICIFISSAASIAVSLSLKFLLDDFIIPLIGQTRTLQNSIRHLQSLAVFLHLV